MENGNKPAFACTDGDTFYESGLTKREYFAGLAMQGIISNYRTVDPPPSHIAEMSIKYADELLKQLEN